MRTITRVPLSETAARYLIRQQATANEKHGLGTLNVRLEWENARKSKPMRSILLALKAMTGPRERCMYCVDSHGTDIEHFQPKMPTPQRIFDWPNLLLCCTECGRFKGNRFPRSGSHSLLIDPTKEDPWKHLDFDPDTGNICARFDARTNNWSTKGIATVDVLQLDRREALAVGHQKSWSRLCRIVNHALTSPPLDTQMLMAELFASDDHGLLPWCFGDRGRTVQPFSDLRAQHPRIWRQCRAAILTS